MSPCLNYSYFPWGRTCAAAADDSVIPDAIGEKDRAVHHQQITAGHIQRIYNKSRKHGIIRGVRDA